METIIELNGNSYIQTSRPWWLDRSYISPYRNAPVVARVNAVRVADEQNCMLDLVDVDLSIVGPPGILDFPDITDGPRPKTNRTDSPITWSQVQAGYVALQTEGYSAAEPEDRTPWQKVDDFPIEEKLGEV